MKIFAIITQSELHLTLRKLSNPKLLQQLKDTPDSSLEHNAGIKEGAKGDPVKLVMSQREMRCYTITESELKQIGLSNIGITGFFSLSSASFAFGLDVFKDTLLAESVPEIAQTIVSYVQPICFFASASFFVFGIITIKWRSDLIALIKRESSES
jgi:hypothetical protein